MLRQVLEEYKKVVSDLIEGVKRDQELSDQLLQRKNDILKKIDEAGYDKVELEKNIKELNILELENELELAIKKEMVKIKKQIENLKTAEIARLNIKKMRQSGIVLFNGKA